ncbi:hypothetical protein BH20ACT19_BH20ACT19_06470 [soil metagenome]
MKSTRRVLIALVACLVAPGVAQASHNDSFFSTVPEAILNTPDGDLPFSVVREHDNIGATATADEPNFCQDGNLRFDYGASVWYDFRPPRDGVVGVFVARTGGQWTPVANIQPYTPPANYDFARSSCQVGALGGEARPTPVAVKTGETWKVQIGGVDGSQGSYRLEFTYDSDRDGDGLLDSADGCDTQGGPASNGGCPVPMLPPDGDDDGISDASDRCPRQDSRGRDRDKDGCLDVLRLHAIADSKLSFDQFRGGIEVKRLAVTGVPRGARVKVTCLGPRRGGRRRSCGGQLVRSAKTLVLRRFRGKRLRVGTAVVIRITARQATGKYIRYTVIRRGVGAKRIDRCTNAGSRKLRRTGCR